MSCQNCANGSPINQPCSQQNKPGCGGNGFVNAVTGAVMNGDVNVNLNGATGIYRNPCTGEVKQALPQVQANQKPEFDVVAVKMVPKKAGTCGPVKQPCEQRKCCVSERKVTCYQCGPKRADAYPADHKCYNLEYLTNFGHFFVGQEDEHDWNFFTNGDDFIADDGKHRLSVENGLFLQAKEFKKTTFSKHGEKHCEGLNASGFLDHFKTFVILNSDFTVPDCGELYAQACMAVRTYGTEKHPFGDKCILDHLSDFRLAYGAFSMIEFDSGLHIAVIQTNTAIYALYERLPLDNDDGIDEEIGTTAFAYAEWIGSRNGQDPLNDFSQVGLALDKHKKTARWYLDGVVKWEVDRLGYPQNPHNALYILPGEPTPINLKCVHVGIGLFTMLDAVTPVNHRDIGAAGVGLARLTGFEYQHPWIHKKQVRFIDEKGSVDSRLFGQGAALRIRELKVETRA